VLNQLPPRATHFCVESTTPRPNHCPHRHFLLNLPREAKARTMTAMIEVHDLVKQFGAFTAVDRISFSVPTGTIRAFLGPNGAGKITTIKILTTTLLPTSGLTKVAGHDPAREPTAAHRAFGIVFQDPSLDDELTADENMQLHGVLYGNRLPPSVGNEATNQWMKSDAWYPPGSTARGPTAAVTAAFDPLRSFSRRLILRTDGEQPYVCVRTSPAVRID
jgi:hypothetical protein